MTREIQRSLQQSHIDGPADVRMSRRGFLGGVSLVGLGAATGAVIPSALAQGQGAPASGGSAQPAGPQPLDYPGKDKGLAVLGERPLVAETPEHLLDDETTPISRFFIRNNGQIPEPAANPDA